MTSPFKIHLSYIKDDQTRELFYSLLSKQITLNILQTILYRTGHF